MAQEGKPWDRMAFCYSHDHMFLTLFLMQRYLIDARKRVRNLCSGLYARDAEADSRGVLRTVMRPRIPIRITNVHSARRGGSDSGYVAAALADSGADATFITRKAADWIGIDLDALDKADVATPFGRFKVHRTPVRVAVLYRGRGVGPGKVPASIPEKDIVRLGNRPYIVMGRSNVFDQYSVEFDDYRQILTMKRTAPGQASPAGADAAPWREAVVENLAQF